MPMTREQMLEYITAYESGDPVEDFYTQLDFAGLRRIAGDVYQTVEQPIGIFCTLPVMR